MIKDIISLSEIGLCRQENQDSVLAVNTGSAGLFIVADGMGGHYQGQLASQTAMEFLKKWWERIYKCIDSLPFSEIVTELEKKIKEINKSIFQIYKEKGQRGGTTLCLLLMRNNTYVVMNVGDSRLYRCKGWSCTQMTTDDVCENWIYKNKIYASNHLYKGKLVQALGINEDVMIHVYTGLLQKKEYFFLCSDGVYKYCSKQYLFWEIKKLFWKKDIVKVVERIKKKIYKNGAKDNLSMILFLAEPNKKDSKQ